MKEVLNEGRVGIHLHIVTPFIQYLCQSLMIYPILSIPKLIIGILPLFLFEVYILVW